MIIQAITYISTNGTTAVRSATRTTNTARQELEAVILKNNTITAPSKPYISMQPHPHLHSCMYNT